MKKGEYFSELEFFSDKLTDTAARATSIVYCAYLEKKDFLEILEEF